MYGLIFGLLIVIPTLYIVLEERKSIRRDFEREIAESRKEDRNNKKN